MASAQNAVAQSGAVTPFHGTSWYNNGVVGDAGTVATPFVSSIGMFNGANCPFGISSQTAPGATSAAHSLFSVCQTDSATTVNFLGINGEPAPSVFFNINGNVYPFPGPGLGSVTSVNVSPGATGLTATGGPVTSIGTITLGGTLKIANGGTGATTAAGALTDLLPTQTGQSGKVLSTNGTTTGWVAQPTGTVASVTCGTGLTGGTITFSGTCAVNTGAIAALGNANTWPNTQTFSVPIVAPIFTSTVRGLVPASGGGTTNFLRADGTFAAPTSFGGYATVYDVVASFGGDPTGTNSNVTPFNNALAACSASGGGIIWFQGGTYKFSAGISDNIAGCSIQGAGPAATIFKPTGVTGDFLTVTNTGVTPTTVADFQITSGGSWTGYALAAEGSWQSTHDVYFLSVPKAIHVTNSSESRFDRILIYNSTSSPIVSCDNAVGTVFATRWNQVTIGWSGTNTTATPMELGNGCNSATLDTVGIIQGADCLQIDAGFTFLFTNDLECDFGLNGVVVDGGEALHFDNSYFQGAASGYDINFGPSFTGGATITGSRIFGAGQGGVLINAANADVTITGNNIGANGNAGIAVGAGVSKFTITGNRIGNIEGFSGQTFCVLVNTGGSDDYIIANNNCVGNTNAVADGGSGGTKSVTGNIGP